MIRRGPSARTPRAGISIRPRGMRFYRRIDRLGDAPPCITNAPKEHALERRAILDAQAWSELCAPFRGSFLAGLVDPLAGSLEVRRARVPLLPARCGARPCNPAHCGGALGWGLVLLDGISDRAIAGLFGLSRVTTTGRQERES